MLRPDAFLHLPVERKRSVEIDELKKKKLATLTDCAGTGAALLLLVALSIAAGDEAPQATARDISENENAKITRGERRKEKRNLYWRVRLALSTSFFSFRKFQV